MTISYTPAQWNIAGPIFNLLYKMKILPSFDVTYGNTHVVTGLPRGTVQQPDYVIVRFT